MTTHSVRKIKPKGLQNTVQPLAVTNKVASGNNVFAKNASVRHLAGVLYIYMYIKKNRICTKATFTNTQLSQVSVCTVWYIYTFTATQAISVLIPSRVLWAAWLTSVPVNSKQHSHFFTFWKDKKQHKTKLLFIRGNQMLRVLVGGWGVSRQLTGHSWVSDDGFISDSPSQPPCLQITLTQEPQGIWLQC